MTEQELKDQLDSIEEFVISTLATLTGLSISDCRKAYNANPDAQIRQILQYMLDNFELSDKTISKIEGFINDCQEEE